MEGPRKPGRSPNNRSLERGIEILRAFRQGSATLGNAELAERSGLSKSTVSRLTQTLVRSGVLQFDDTSRAYRLAPAVLSLAHAMRTGSRVLQLAAPRMRALAETHRINVGLAAPDRDEMVYLESIRYARRAALRHVVSGQRVPMELTSLGRAYLATLNEAELKPLLEAFKRRRGRNWPALAREIGEAGNSVRLRSYCAAAWQPEVVAVATPLRIGHDVYALNVSTSTSEPLASTAKSLAAPLLSLAADIRAAVEDYAFAP
ncbi:IclR family transcriptional regulator [Pigmentiphaga kullae]|uniref:IclR family transcriptional regulator n=1 Tax=Pigmentiphaga kullae TaxID=151784 RepID=A0A4Q7NN55_9BURK|nr:IclR family transcriptional regulator [Pigmentiphaga kullae]RZS86651.1 IclR family transcriptional regulator [Pigmentiphaga kullae]